VRGLLALACGAALCAVAVPAALAASPPPANPTPPAACPGSQPVPAGSPCPPADPLAAQLDQALQEQAQLQAAKAALAGEIGVAKDHQSNLHDLVETNQKTIAGILAKLDAAEKDYAAASARADRARMSAAEARRREAHDRVLLAGFVRQSYTGQQGFVDYILAADSFSDLLDRSATLAQLADRGALLVRKVQDDIHAAEAAEKTAQTAADEARRAADSLAQQRDDLNAQVDHERSLISQLTGQVAAAAVELAQADQNGAALAQHIADLRIQQMDQTILEAEQAAWAAAAYYIQHQLTGLPPSMAPPPGEGSTRFVWPAPGSTISQLFGPSPLTFEPPAFGLPHFHTGLDLAAPMGTPIRAGAAGIVVAANPGTVGYGNYIIVAHDSHTLTLYGHLEAIGVKTGDSVAAGQVVGLMGSTGNSTGPHVHFEVRIDNVPVDPMPLLPPLPNGASGPPPDPQPSPSPGV
jgi:murein DD-endopeptidase MepM/ murein hydrolase activator NlpD